MIIFLFTKFNNLFNYSTQFKQILFRVFPREFKGFIEWFFKKKVL